jgi:hypothetical protein
MGLVRVSYNQLEQLREYKSRLRSPLSQLVEEALSYWLEVIAPAKHGALCVTPLTFLSKKHSRHPCKLSDPGGITEAK